MRAPRTGPAPSTQTEGIETSPVKPVVLGAIRFFQKNLSPLDGPRCVLYPTCSRYGYLAIKKYGVFKGIMMTGDRLIRCNPSRTADHNYHLLPDGRLYDPLARNAFVYE
jgi:putative membrane protein insertion efficiency factor